jgi:hypothetical protein
MELALGVFVEAGGGKAGRRKGGKAGQCGRSKGSVVKEIQSFNEWGHALPNFRFRLARNRWHARQRLFPQKANDRALRGIFRRSRGHGRG